MGTRVEEHLLPEDEEKVEIVEKKQQETEKLEVELNLNSLPHRTVDSTVSEGDDSGRARPRRLRNSDSNLITQPFYGMTLEDTPRHDFKNDSLEFTTFGRPYSTRSPSFNRYNNTLDEHNTYMPNHINVQEGSTYLPNLSNSQPNNENGKNSSSSDLYTSKTYGHTGKNSILINNKSSNSPNSKNSNSVNKSLNSKNSSIFSPNHPSGKNSTPPNSTNNNPNVGNSQANDETPQTKERSLSVSDLNASKETGSRDPSEKKNRMPRRSYSSALLTRSYSIIKQNVIDTFISFLKITDGRNKLFMLVQYGCQLARYLVGESYSMKHHSIKLTTVEDAMSEARKTLRYFKFIEEAQKMMDTVHFYAKGRRISTILNLFGQLCSIFYLLSDHLVLIVQLGLVQMSQRHLSQLKITKSRWSILRILVLFLSDGWAFFKGKISPFRLFIQYLEHASNFVIAGNGYRLWNLHDGYLGASGLVAAFVACYNFLKSQASQYS